MSNGNKAKPEAPRRGPRPCSLPPKALRRLREKCDKAIISNNLCDHRRKPAPSFRRAPTTKIKTIQRAEPGPAIKLKPQYTGRTFASRHVMALPTPPLGPSKLRCHRSYYSDEH